MSRFFGLCLCVLIAPHACAEGLLRWEQNSSGLGEVYAGSAAVADNAGTNYYNPAGLRLLKGSQLSLGRTRTYGEQQFRQLANNNGLQASHYNESDDLIRGNLYAAKHISPNVSIGFGVSSPFGLHTHYKPQWIGAEHALDSYIDSINFNPSIAWQYNKNLSLGLGANLQHMRVKFSRLVGNQTNFVKADGESIGWNMGMIYSFSPDMRVGLSVRPGTKVHLRGSKASEGFPPVQATLKLPDLFVWSVYQRLSKKWEALGDLSYTRWGRVKPVDFTHTQTGAHIERVDFGYRNAWRAAWGARYALHANWKLKFGAAIEGRAPHGHNVRLIAGKQSYQFGVGVQYKTFWKAGLIDIGYNYKHQTKAMFKDTLSNASGGSIILDGQHKARLHTLGVQYTHHF